MRLATFGIAAAVAGSVAAGAAFVLGACNVKIDSSVLDDAGADVFAPSVVACHAPGDCKSADPCVTARCDDGTQQCVFDVCPTGDQCTAASCTTAGKCGIATNFGWHAGSFSIPAGLGCPTCAGAVFPFLFIATDLDVRAYRLSDPTNSTPPEVHFTRLPFAPRTVLTSGRRVYFVGAPSGANTAPYQLQVASIDVPADAGAKSLDSRITTFPFPSQDFRFDGALAGTGDQLFSLHLVQTYENNQTVFRDEELQMHTDPNQDPGALNFFLAKSFPPNGRSVAFTGGRIAVYHTADGGAGTMSFDQAPGTNDSNNTGDQLLPDMGTPGASTFASTADGAVYWAAAQRLPPVQNQPQMIGGVRLTAALSDANSTVFSAASKIDLETYSPGVPENPGNGTTPNPYAGPIAPMGNGAALVLAAARENPAQTSVQLVTKSGAAIQLVAGKRFLVPSRVDQVAAAGTTGFAYVVNPDTTTSMTVHIFSASCQ